MLEIISNYKIIITPIFIGIIIVQSIKILIKSNNLKFNLKNYTAYSGMPSGHSAMVSSLTTMIGLEHGINSTIFAFSFVFTLLVIRDAVGMRQYLGRHGKILNTIIEDLKNDKLLDEKYPHLLEKIGHTPMQVFVGVLIGVSTSFVIWNFL